VLLLELLDSYLIRSDMTLEFYVVSFFNSKFESVFFTPDC